MRKVQKINPVNGFYLKRGFARVVQEIPGKVIGTYTAGNLLFEYNVNGTYLTKLIKRGNFRVYPETQEHSLNL